MLLAFYFRWVGPQGEALHIASSSDGRNFAPFNGGQPTFAPAQRIRDPFVGWSNADAAWHLLATKGEGFGAGCSFRHWRSRGLLSWDPKDDVVACSTQTGGASEFTWAPEFIEDRDGVLAFWSSRLTGAPFRILASRTADWRRWSTPFVMVDRATQPEGPQSVIDASIVREHGEYVLFVADEPFGARHAIWRAIAPRADGPWSGWTEVATPGVCEAPAPARLHGEWLLYYDCTFAPHRRGRPPYGLSASAGSLGSLRAVPGSCAAVGQRGGVSLPRDASHASFASVNGSTALALQRTFAAADGGGRGAWRQARELSQALSSLSS